MFISSSKVIKNFVVSMLLLMAGQVHAGLVVSINQVSPVPPACVGSGDTITYAVTVSNNGPTSLRDLSFVAILTSQSQKSGICLTSASGGECQHFCLIPQQNGLQARSHSRLQVDSSFVFTITFKVCTPQPLTDTLTLSAQASGIDCSGNQINSGVVTAQSCVSGCGLAATVCPSYPVSVCQGGQITLQAKVTGCCSSLDNMTFVWKDPNGNVVGTNSPLLVLSDSFTQGVYTVTVTDPFNECVTTGSSGFISIVVCTEKVC